VHYSKQEKRIITALRTSVLIFCSPGSVSGPCWAKAPSEVRFGLGPVAAIHQILGVGSKFLDKTKYSSL